MFLCVIRSFHDQLRRRMSMNGVMHFILNGRIESSRRCSIFIVINSCGIEVSDLLIEFSFAGTDLTDSL